METAVIGDTSTERPGRDGWLRRIILFAAVIFVLVLAYLLVNRLISSVDEEPAEQDDPVNGNGAVVDDTTPGALSTATLPYGTGDSAYVTVSCLPPTRDAPIVILAVNSGPETVSIGVESVVTDGSDRSFDTLAIVDGLLPGEVRSVLPRVKAEAAVTLIGGVADCQIMAVEQDDRLVRFGQRDAPSG